MGIDLCREPQDGILEWYSKTPMGKLAQTCIRLAWRDLLAERWRTLAHLGIIALSVMSYVGIRSSEGVFAEALDQRFRSELGADLSIENWITLDTEQWAVLDRLRAAGGVWTLVTSTTFEAGSDAVPDTVSAVLKAVDPDSYPLYGEVELEPKQPLSRALAGNSMAVSPDLLRELGAHVGDSIRINGLPCPISAIIAVEPDRHHGNLPSVVRGIVSRSTLEKSGLLRSGVPPLQRILVRFPKGAQAIAMREELGRAFVDVQHIISPEESDPDGKNIADAAGSFLGIVGWLAFTLGAAGVLLLTRLHAESRLETLATLKCLGARPRQILVWLVVEVLFIGGAGGFVGGLAGGAARRLLCGLAQIHQMPELVSARLIVEGTIAGLALALIPGIAVAWSTSSVRPADVFRRMARPVSPVAWRMAFVATWIVLGLLSGVAAGVARMAAVLAWAVGSLLILLYFSARGVFAFLAMWTPIHLGAAFRQGWKNLCRPGSSSPVALAILALIAALAVGAAAGEQIVGQEILANSPWPHANLYILGFEDSDLDGFLTILNRHSGIERPYRVATLAWLRIGDGPRMIFTCSPSQPAGSGVILDTSLARRLGVVVGSILDFEQDEHKIRAAVSQIHDLSPAERVWFSASFPCASFAGLKIFHHAGLRVREDEMAGLMRDLRRGYPSVDIDTSENMLEMVHDLATNAVALVRFIAFAAAAGGAVVAMALIGASAARRAREIAILQMLGARPAYVVAMLGWEFAGLGALAGLLGGGFGIVLINGVLSAIFYKALINPHVAIMAVSTVCGAGTGLLAGFIVCSRLIFQKPLVTLRTE